MKFNKHTYLTVGILAGLVLGVVIGQLIYSYADVATRDWAVEMFEFVGTTFFMNLLRMVLIPLVASSVIVGVASIGDPSALGRIGFYTLFYYFSTMLIAVVLGIVVVNTIKPGAGMDSSILEQGEQAYAETDSEKREAIETRGKGGLWFALKNILGQLVPSNPLAAAVKGQVLPIITVSILLGIGLTVIGEAGRPLLAVFESLFAVVMKMVDWILLLAPMGVMCLVAFTVAKMGGAGLIGPLVWYMVAVLVGLSIHAFVILPLALWIFGRTNPYRFMHQMREALMTAFGTDSSSATLPVTMEVAEEVGGVSKEAAGFVLPLGATVNMDGTALYEAVAVVFLFQCYGVDLSLTQLGIIAATATLAAIGAAGIPSAGLVTMVIVVQAVNSALGPDATHLPLAAVGVLLGVDRILDMCRTTVNVWGDAVGAKIISRYLGS